MMTRQFLVSIGLLTLAWLILEPSWSGWAAGLLAVTTGMALRLYAGRLRHIGLHPLRLPRFGLYFLTQSVSGGWDVSRRALTPSLPLSPDLIAHHLSLSSQPARVFVSNVLSLLPGTVAADLRGDLLIVHVLVTGSDAEARVRTLEARVAHLFGAEGP